MELGDDEGEGSPSSSSSQGANRDQQQERAQRKRRAEEKEGDVMEDEETEGPLTKKQNRNPSPPTITTPRSTRRRGQSTAVDRGAGNAQSSEASRYCLATDCQTSAYTRAHAQTRQKQFVGRRSGVSRQIFRRGFKSRRRRSSSVGRRSPGTQGPGGEN